MVEIYFVGVLGALSREAFRWRRLYTANRIREYATWIYVCIAGVIVVLSGFTALVFAPMIVPVDGPSVLPMSFVIGAGFELLVLQASKLTMPSISMGSGDETERPPSLAEFLRV